MIYISLLLQYSSKSKSESSLIVQTRIVETYQRQIERAGKINQKLTNKEVNKCCKLNGANKSLLETAIIKFGLSVRAMHRILKVSRTIADLDNSNAIESRHLTEAITYRRLDRDRSLLL